MTHNIGIPEIIPNHECDGECEYPATLALIAMQTGPEAMVDTTTVVHNISIATAAETLVKMFDQIIQETAPEGIPPLIAFARGREFLRESIEKTAAPGDVSANLDEFTKMFDSSETEGD